MLVPEPDKPLVLPMFTPGALPFNKRAISISGFCSKSFLLIEETA